MHKLNVLIYGSENFKSTIIEIKSYLKFNLLFSQKKLSDIDPKDFDGLISNEYNIKDIPKDLNVFKILATNENKNKKDIFDYTLNLPISVKEINNVIESVAAKKKFSKNSSIQIKSYFLDKNEKKLSKDNKSITLTEKEIQLLELFLNKDEPISKNEVLSLVWHYSSDADTHTVETHIYRLRKKIKQKFNDENFILNNKNGYYL